jgi:hypothetical protein
MEYYSGGNWHNLNLPTPVFTKNVSEWDMTNLYASITNTWKQIKTRFILKNSNAPTQLRFQITMVGLIYNPTDGSLTSSTDGLVWGYIQLPWAKDATGANLPITQTYDGTYITWVLDPAGATYPIEVDPIFVDGYGGTVETACDTGNASSSPSTNYGNYAELSFWNYSNGITTLLRFTLTSLSGATIVNATLSITLYSGASGGASTYTHRLKSGNSGWVENTATWDRTDGTNSWLGGSSGGGIEGTDYETTIMGETVIGTEDGYGTILDFGLNTTEFTGMVNANAGLLVYQDNDGYSSSIFASDSASTGYRPKLTVTYTESGTRIILDTA